MLLCVGDQALNRDAGMQTGAVGETLCADLGYRTPYTPCIMAADLH